MEHLENDMDDLFQKAGELYPLKTSEPDWKTVLGKLNEEGFGTQAVPGMTAKGTRNRRRLLFLLFLIPLGLGSISYFSKSKIHHNPDSVSTNLKLDNRTSRNKAISKTAVQNEPSNYNLNKQTAIDKTELQKESIRKISELPGNTAIGNNRPGQMRPSVIGKKQVLIADGIFRSKNKTQFQKINSSVIGSEIINDNLALSETAGNNQKELKETLAEKPLSLSVIDFNKIISVEALPLSSTATKNLIDSPPAGNPKKQNNSSSAKGFYVGLFGGPDLSMVKFQSVKQLGYSLGFLAGYRINKRFSIETGLMWDKKYYYSSGEYFNKSEISLPPTTSILTVNGNCNMWEIPISMRYDFAYGKNHEFFIKGGFSSYLMKHESYVGSADSAGYNPWDYHFKSDGTKNYFLSIIQLSAGYEYSISAKTKMSFEPYVKIPLQGFGIGSMPISSAGFYIGISYSFR